MRNELREAMTSPDRRRRALGLTYLGALIGAVAGPIIAAFFWFVMDSVPGALASVCLAAVWLGLGVALRRSFR